MTTLNPSSVLYTDASGNPIDVSGTTPLPVTTGGETSAGSAATDPNKLSALTDAQLLRGILSVLQDFNAKNQERLDGILIELQALSTMIAGAFDIQDGPDAYRG